MTNLSFDPTVNPDVQAFKSRKYGHTGLWIMLLPSGTIAVADHRRQLIALGLAPVMLSEVVLGDLLRTARDAPTPEPSPEPVYRKELPEDLDDLDLQI